MRQIWILSLVTFLTVISGCHCGCCGKRESELHCPTDVRKAHCWCFGEDALMHCPCGPDEEYYGHKPTCWRAWPASAEQWRDERCGPLPGMEMPEGGEMYLPVQEPTTPSDKPTAPLAVPPVTPETTPQQEPETVPTMEDARGPSFEPAPLEQPTSKMQEPPALELRQVPIRKTRTQLRPQPLQNPFHNSERESEQKLDGPPLLDFGMGGDAATSHRATPAVKQTSMFSVQPVPMLPEEP